MHENVSFNLSAACLSRFCTASFVNRGKVLENARSYIRDLGIATPSERQLVKNLSGGNQQKVAVGKWLAADCDLYIFDEPTKGVDVGAKQDIFHLIQKIAAEGNAVLYATCENAELLSLTCLLYTSGYGGGHHGSGVLQRRTASGDEGRRQDRRSRCQAYHQRADRGRAGLRP